jgi:hypothetical protein
VTTAYGVTLAAVLDHPDWAGVAVLAPPPEPSPVIRAVSVVADLRSRPEQLPGHLLAVVLSGDRSDWRLDALLHRAAAAGACAVLLPTTEPLPRGSAALAARVRMPVLGSDAPLDAALAARALVAEGERYTADLVLRTTEACVRARTGLDGVLNAAGAVLGRPVALVDGSGSAVVGADLLDLPERAAVREAVGASAASARAAFRLELAGGAELLAHPVPTEQSETRIWLAVRLPHRLPVESAAVAAALSVAAAVTGQQLSVRRLAVERDARSRASLLGELLHTPGEIATSTRRRALDAGWRLDGWHIGVQLDAGPDVDAVALRPDLVAALAEQGLDPVVVEQGDGWSAWTTVLREPEAAEIEAHAAAVRRAQRRLAPAVPTSVGVGRAHAGPLGLARTLGEAGEAARLAASRVPSGRFLHVDRLGLGRMLLAWTRTDTFQPAARSLLAPLHGQPGDLLQILTTYLDAESSVTETAAVLGIHRNTVATRVRRIQELLDIDLDDPDERLALHLACRTTWTPQPAEEW